MDLIQPLDCGVLRDHHSNPVNVQHIIAQCESWLKESVTSVMKGRQTAEPSTEVATTVGKLGAPRLGRALKGPSLAFEG